VLREILHYNRLTGVFRWREQHRNVRARDVAGRINHDGYRQISIGDRRYQAARLAWLYVYGVWPNHQIDHKNGIRDDDRFVNLRDVTPSENKQNQRQASGSSKTGLLGVCQHHGSFQAQIQLGGKNIYLGMFATAEAAHAAYIVAKRNLHATCTI
jgi:hypothetical protein